MPNQQTFTPMKASAVWYRGRHKRNDATNGIMVLNDTTFQFTDETGKASLTIPLSDIKKVLFRINLYIIPYDKKQYPQLVFQFTDTKQSWHLLFLGVIGQAL